MGTNDFFDIWIYDREINKNDTVEEVAQ